MSVRLISGDCRDVLRTLPDQSVHCIVTSPPYFGLRDYGTAKWEGGDPACEHRVGEIRTGMGMVALGARYRGGGHKAATAKPLFAKDVCPHCGAHRIDAQIGIEQTPDDYVAEIVAVFREAKRVLRDDGTLWLNIGSSFCSRRMESDDHVLRRNLPNALRSKVFKAMSSVWYGETSPESALQKLLGSGTQEAGELSSGRMREVRNGVSGSQVAQREGPGPLLLQDVREIREPNAQARTGRSELPDVRCSRGAISGRDEEESHEERLLRSGMLVEAQPGGQPLSLGRWPAREDESGWNCLAEGSASAGLIPLPQLLCRPEAGGASHPSVQEPSATALGCIERGDAMPGLSQGGRPQGDGVRGNFRPDGCDAFHDLGRFQFPRSAIPSGFVQFCEPARVVKPKDDLGIPWMLAFALRADGWYLRQDNIWNKSSCMPESCTDRSTRSHEYVFMFSKRSSYFYDAEAVSEPAVTFGRQKTDGMSPKLRAKQELGHISKSTGCDDPYKYERRNRRSVWTIATEPNSLAHFAIMPSALAEICIKAGCPVGGTVLDPFAGVGTSGLVADRLGRDAVLIELSETNAAMARGRIKGDAGLFAEVSAL